MSEAAVKEYTDFVLPPSVVSRADVSRLMSALEQFDDAETTATVRDKAGAAAGDTPALPALLADFFSKNGAPETPRDRSELQKQLQRLKDKAPVVHMTFAVTADPESLERLVGWVRTSVHPQALIAVGLQPSLIAGVYLRTPNHVHDLSLRALFANKRGVLVKELEALRGRN